MRCRELILPFAVVVIVTTMLLPLPTWLLDLMLAGNLIFALLLLLCSIYVSEPLRLSVFPALLLLGTLYRLALNIATTRLIIGTGHAGDVVQAFGDVVMQGNIAVGLVVFLVITLVQFIVIAKGGERVAEVAARFTLDALPGKQMSIDADMRAGLLSPAEAREKRDRLQLESRFYGALDGTMKFIKGDAIAGMVIIAINLVAGIIVGLTMHELSIGEAALQFSILTIGDGLLSQIPSLLNALGAALVVTRVSQEHSPSLADEIVGQLLTLPKVGGVLAVSALGVAAIPGLPASPFIFFAVLIGFISFVTSELRKAPRPIASPPRPKPLVEITLPSKFVEYVGSPEMATISIDKARMSLHERTGILLPRPGLRIIPEAISVVLSLRGVDSGEFVPTDQSTFWQDIEQLMEKLIVKRGEELIDDALTRRLMEFYDPDYCDIIRGVVPEQCSVTKLTGVLRSLVREHLSVRSFDVIVQAIAEHSDKLHTHRLLIEHVRIALKREISQPFIIAGRLTAITLHPLADLRFMEAERQGKEVLLEFVESVLDEIKQLSELSTNLVLITSKASRQQLSDLIRMRSLSLQVIAYEEITSDVKVEVFGEVGKREAKQSAPDIELLEGRQYA